MPLSAAVVGTGFIGPVHVECLMRAGVSVRGILGSTPEKSRTAASALGFERAYTDLNEVLDDIEVDVVHLTTPNRLHYQQAKSVLEAGKHVLCEKPLAMNSSESSELVKLANETNLAAGVAYNIRFYPICHEAAARVQKGELGDILHINGAYVQDWLLKDTDFNWRVLAEEGGELRAVSDIGTHWLDLAQFICGQKVVAVCADLQTVHSIRQRPIGNVETFAGKSGTPSQTDAVHITTEDAGCILLKFENGARGSVRVSQVTAGRKNSLLFELAGSKQAISWNSEHPNEMWIGNRDRANEVLIRDPALLNASAAKRANYPGGHNEGFPDTFKQLFRSFYEYIQQGDISAPAPFPTFEDGHHEILLCDAILESHRKQAWVNLGDKS